MRDFGRLSTVAAALAAFAGGVWVGSAQPTTAQSAAAGNQNMRFLLDSSSEGSMFMIDTWTGETWTLAPAGVDGRNLRQWVRMVAREAQPRRPQ